MKILIACCLVVLPLRHLRVTSSFGNRRHPVTGKFAFHSGVDLKARRDTVYAIMDGVVKSAGFERLLGLYISLDHGEFKSSYGHLSQIFIVPGDYVNAGDPIGITGATGRVTGEHLHFSMVWRNQPLDPLDFLYQNLINKDHE